MKPSPGWKLCDFRLNSHAASSHEGVQQLADTRACLTDLGQAFLFQFCRGLLDLGADLRRGRLFGGTAQIAGIGYHVEDGCDGLAHLHAVTRGRSVTNQTSFLKLKLY